MPDSIADTSIGEEQAQSNAGEPDVIQGEAPAEETGGTSWMDILLADAEPDDGTYESHALNWDRTESTAKIIRGAEGMLGNLNKAIILILIGVVQKVTEYQEGEDEPEEPEAEDLGQELEGDEI